MISLTHLKYFQDAALLGGVGAAAKRHRLSPSAVSQAIRGLETHFGLQLLKHSKNRFELTAEGQALVDRSFKVFAATEALQEEMDWLKEANAGHLNFATQQSIAHHLLPAFLAQLQRDYPHLQPKIRLGPTDVAKQWVEMHDVEFSLSVDNIGHEALTAVPIYSGEFLLVASTAAVEALKKEPVFITPGETTREARTFRRDY